MKPLSFLGGSPEDNARKRDAHRRSARKLKKVPLLKEALTSQWVPRFLLDHANSLEGFERECLLERICKASPDGEPFEYLGYTYVYDEDREDWKLMPIGLHTVVRRKSVIEFPPYVYKEGAPNPSLTPNEDPEIQAAQAVEISRLMAEKEAADLAEKKDVAFANSNMPAVEQPAQENVSLRLRHED